MKKLQEDFQSLHGKKVRMSITIEGLAIGSAIVEFRYDSILMLHGTDVAFNFSARNIDMEYDYRRDIYILHIGNNSFIEIWEL